LRRPLGQELDPDILDHPNGGAAQQAAQDPLEGVAVVDHG